jgi:hypothetical protein
MSDFREVVLSKKEIQLILESLLYFVSPELDHTRYQEDLIESTQLAIRLRMAHQNIPTSNIIFMENISEPSGYTSELLKFFPEISRINL